jgi:hypothetical protein
MNIAQAIVKASRNPGKSTNVYVCLALDTPLTALDKTFTCTIFRSLEQIKNAPKWTIAKSGIMIVKFTTWIKNSTYVYAIKKLSTGFERKVIPVKDVMQETEPDTEYSPMGLIYIKSYNKVMSAYMLKCRKAENIKKRGKKS